jgi:hypothetical protein
MKRFPRILLSTLLLGMLATPLAFEGVASAATLGVVVSTQTPSLVPAGSPAAYSTITVSGATRNDYLKLGIGTSGLPSGATWSDSDGCVQDTGFSGSVTFSHFTVVAGAVGGAFELVASEYSSSQGGCTGTATSTSTATPTLSVTPLAVTNPTQTTNPAAGNSTTYSMITVSNAFNDDYVALAGSGLPSGAVSSDAGDGCAAVSATTATFKDFTVTAGVVGGSFTLTANEYANSGCTGTPTTTATATPTLTVKAPTLTVPTQTPTPVVAGSSTTYAPITFTGGFNGDYVALAGSGLPTGAVSSDTGDGCVVVSGGIATFEHFSVLAATAGGGFTITANEYSNSSCTTLVTSATTTPMLSVTPYGSAAQLAFSTQPAAGANIQASGTGTFPISVAVEDVNGNLVANDSTGTVTLSIATNPGPGVLTCSGGLTATVASGTASFAGCAITKTGTGYKLTAASSPAYNAPSNATSFSITAGATTTVALSQGYNESTTVGGPFASAMIARVTDADGNPVSGATVTFTAPSTGASGTFKAAAGTCTAGGAATTSCSATTSSTGQASSLVFSANATTGSYNVAVTSTGTTPLENPMTNTVGAASILTFVAQPNVGQNIQATGTGTFGATVAIEDIDGNLEMGTNSGAVTLGLAANPTSGVLSCAGGLTSNVLAGEASFTGCSITSAGVGYTLSASSSPSYTAPTNANAFNITAGSASQLAFVAQPSNAFVGAAMVPPVTVQVEDQNCNASSGSATIGLTPSASALASGGTAVASGGVATFSGLTFSESGLSLSLTATSPGLTSATSATFDVSVLVSKSSDTLTDGATASGGSGMKSVTYYYCAGFSNTPTACGPSNGTEIGSPATASPFSVTWSSLPASGAYRVVAVGTNNAGNSTTSATTPVNVDSSGPVGGAISAPNYATTLSVAITSTNFTDSTVGMSSNVITRSGGLSPTSGVCPSSGYTGSTAVSSPDTGVVSGKCYEYTLTGTSNAGQVTGVTSAPVLVDTTAPVTTITLNPASPNGTNGWYDGTNPTFTLSATDAGGSGVETTYYEIDGGAASVYPGSAVTIPNGATQSVTYWSLDNAGNVESAHTTAALSIDTGSPTGSTTAPAANATVSGSAVTVSSNSTDSLSGVASATFQYEAVGGSSWTTIGTPDTSSPYSVSWNASALSGQYDLRVVTTDNAGNSSTSAIVPVTVTAQTTGTYSGASSGNMSNGTYYYSINATTTGSGTKTANSITPNTAETLTGLTFNLLSTSGSPHSVTIDLIAGSTPSATALTCSIPAESSQCTATASVTIPVGDAINVAGLGNGNHAGTWTTTYTKP